MRPPPLSILDTVPITDAGTGADAIHASVELAALADRLGYTRYWFAEHHAIPSVASTAPEILIAHVATQTRRIRLGAGGVMLLNHAPLLVAERYHTLAALHPGRIDLGIGRAPGSDPRASDAIRTQPPQAFADELATLRGLSLGMLPPSHRQHTLRVYPEAPLPPIWLLGSSGASARWAGQKGLGYAFASHFSTTPAPPAFIDYRDAFEPSIYAREESHAILAVSVVCAETAGKALELAETVRLVFAWLRTGRLDRVPSPQRAAAHRYTPAEEAAVRDLHRLVIVGTPEVVKAEIIARTRATAADEVMITQFVHDPADRATGMRLLAQAFELKGE
jgi:luciferase family oxidoreductase group 1